MSQEGTACVVALCLCFEKWEGVLIRGHGEERAFYLETPKTFGTTRQYLGKASRLLGVSHSGLGKGPQKIFIIEIDPALLCRPESLQRALPSHYLMPSFGR